MTLGTQFGRQRVKLCESEQELINPFTVISYENIKHLVAFRDS
jgi:hypothetical protein